MTPWVSARARKSLPDYLDHLSQPACVAGLIWRDGKELVKNIPRPIIKDLNQFPYPDRSTLPIDYIESLPLDVPAVLSLESSARCRLRAGVLTPAFIATFRR